jgi:hypothetical protein
MNIPIEKKSPIILGSIFLVLLASALFLYSKDSPAQPTNDPNFTIDNLNLVDSKRVSRTDYEYSYTADITNTGSNATNTTATVTSTSATTTIVEGGLTFGDVASGTTATSADTFTIRQNRTAIFDPVSLQYDIEVTHDENGLPPDPGEAGKLTLEGIDSDGDGVRDDVQIYIALTYLDSEKIRASLTQYVKSVQSSLIDAKYKQISIQRSQEVVRALECVGFVDPDNGLRNANLLLTKILNTEERSEAYLMYNSQLAGESSFLTPLTIDSLDDTTTACDFDPSLLGS